MVRSSRSRHVHGNRVIIFNEFNGLRELLKKEDMVTIQQFVKFV